MHNGQELANATVVSQANIQSGDVLHIERIDVATRRIKDRTAKALASSKLKAASLRPWQIAVKKAREELKLPRNSKPLKGLPLWQRAHEIKNKIVS